MGLLVHMYSSSDESQGPDKTGKARAETTGAIPIEVGSVKEFEQAFLNFRTLGWEIDRLVIDEDAAVKIVDLHQFHRQRPGFA